MTTTHLYPSKNPIHDQWLSRLIDSLFPYRFQRFGKYGYFQKLDEKMSYNDGQIACSKLFGHIIEFDERVQLHGK